VQLPDGTTGALLTGPIAGEDALTGAVGEDEPSAAELHQAGNGTAP
jgi:hypothetical protein